MKKLLSMAALCIAYVGFRLWGITDSCLWFDEIFGIHAAEHPWGSILPFIALDLIHPPLFYLLLKIWIGFGGESLFWLRLFPVVFAVIAIFPFLALCKELKLSFWTKMFALFFFAVNGSLIKYAQEVRMYSLLLCLALFSMWLFSRYLNRAKGFVPLLIVNVLLVYAHYFGWLVIGAEVAAILFLERTRLRRFMAMTAVVMVCFSAWAIAIYWASGRGSGLGQNIGWTMRPGLKAITQFVLNLVEPFYYQASSADPIAIFKVSVPILLIIAAAVISYLSRWESHEEDERKAIRFLCIFSILPMSVAFLVSWVLPHSVWGSRHLIIVFAPVSIVCAIAITRLSRVAVQTAAVVFVLLFSGYALTLTGFKSAPPYIWCAWDDVAREFAHSPDNETRKIYVFEDLVAYHLWFALRDQQNTEIIRVTGIDVFNDDAYFLPRGFDRVGRIDEGEITGERITIAFRSREFDAAKAPISNLVARGYKVIETVPFPAGGANAYLCKLTKFE